MTKTKKIMVVTSIIILLLSLGIYIDYFFQSNKEEANDIGKVRGFQQEKNLGSSSNQVNENKYYIVYIKYGNGSGSSFVPEKLNPSFKNNIDYHVSLSFDDNGNILNNDKVILINDFVISKENKEMIKEIAGKEKFEKALKEIEKRVNHAKKNIQEQGLPT